MRNFVKSLRRDIGTVGPVLLGLGLGLIAREIAVITNSPEVLLVGVFAIVIVAAMFVAMFWVSRDKSDPK